MAKITATQAKELEKQAKTTEKTMDFIVIGGMDARKDPKPNAAGGGKKKAKTKQESDKEREERLNNKPSTLRKEATQQRQVILEIMESNNGFAVRQHKAYVKGTNGMVKDATTKFLDRVYVWEELVARLANRKYGNFHQIVYKLKANNSKAGAIPVC